MSYEPTILILKEDLDKNTDFIVDGDWQWEEKGKYAPGKEKRKVLEFLQEILTDNNSCSIAGIKLYVCKPEFTSFNEAVRNQLDEFEIEYTTCS